MLLLWDIDGTLLTTARAGIAAWEQALYEVSGVRADLGAFDTAGHPDFQIATRLLADVARTEPAEGLVEQLVRRYEEHLPAALGRRQGRVLPNVTAILSALEREPGVRSTLLTGNTRRGAAAKLGHYGLDRFFQGGSFSEFACERGRIARTAMDLARAAGWISAPPDAVVIGDTPHDIQCGRAVGARTVAVATGTYGVDELRRHGAWRVVAELPPPDRFIRMLEGAEVSADA